MVEPDDFLPDEDAIEERRPTNCPFCGHSGAFDGQGWQSKTTYPRACAEPETLMGWYQHRCPECNGRFRMLTAVDIDRP